MARDPMISTEIRLPVPEYEGVYEISTFGRIRSLHKHTPTIMKIKLKYSGYVDITLCKKGIKTTYLVHRLVAKVFIPNPDNHPETKHKDFVKSNNYATNLEWVSREQNRSHADNAFRQDPSVNPAAVKKLTLTDVENIRAAANTKMYMADIARQYGVSHSAIRSIIHGRVWSSSFKGTERPIKKLRTLEEIRAIKKDLSDGMTQAQVARKHNASTGMVWRYAHGLAGATVCLS